MIDLYDTPSEVQCLGLAMFQHTDEVLAFLTEESFGDWRHRKIYSAIEHIKKQGHNVDMVAVTGVLNARQELVEGFDRQYITDIGLAASPQYSNPTGTFYCIERVAALHRARQVVRACQQTIENVYDNPDAVDDTAQQAASTIGSINSGLRQKPKDIGEIVDSVVADIEHRAAEGLPPGLTTGFANIDHFFCFKPGELVLLAARPSMGKSALAAQIAYRVARTNKRVLFFSLEMTKEALVQRLLSVQGQVETNRIRIAQLDPGDWDRIINAQAVFKETHLVFDDQWALGIPALASRARMTNEPYDLIVVDYLQLITPRQSRKGDNRVAEVSEISRDLKLLAKRLNVPILALSQLSRAVESRQNKRPLLSDLRDSGALEQDADIVSFLYRDEYYNPEGEGRGLAEVIIAKNRNGETGTGWLTYSGVTGTFADKENASIWTNSYN